jgi:pyrroline-5-carboxylate reductase
VAGLVVGTALVSDRAEITIGFVGAGSIAGAVARGWGRPILCTDGGSGRAAALVDEVGGRRVASNRELVRSVGPRGTILLAHPVAQLSRVAAEIGDAVDGLTVVSLLAQGGVDQLHELLPGAHVVRALPTPGVEAGVGVTVLAAAPGVPADVLADVRALFDRLGTTVVLPDRQVDAANVAGSMFPAYLALVVEAQIDAAIRVGLAETEATELVLACLRSGVAHLDALDGDTMRLRRSHSTPGGMTVRGLEALERAGVRAAFLAAATAALGERPSFSPPKPVS